MNVSDYLGDDGLVVLALCAVGVETALSGWLTTYSHRADSGGLGGAAVSTSLFWFGIMLSRLAFSTRLLEMIGRRRVLQVMLWGRCQCKSRGAHPSSGKLPQPSQARLRRFAPRGLKSALP